MSKNACLSALICLNLVLLTAIVFATTSPPAAYAQATGLADNYMVVTGEIQDDFDALYIIDMKEHMLHTLYYRKGSNDLEYGGYRLLEQDFRFNRS